VALVPHTRTPRLMCTHLASSAGAQAIWPPPLTRGWRLRGYVWLMCHTHASPRVHAPRLFGRSTQHAAAAAHTRLACARLPCMRLSCHARTLRHMCICTHLASSAGAQAIWPPPLTHGWRVHGCRACGSQATHTHASPHVHAPSLIGRCSWRAVAATHTRLARARLRAWLSCHTHACLASCARTSPRRRVLI
jgi:hypothetical protein